MAKATLDRFMKNVEKTDTCWIWTAYVDPKGYGRFHANSGSALSHRWLYEHINGPIKIGLCCDHLCRNTSCVNPAHIELVTPRENVLRGDSAKRRDFCKSGRHRMTEDNIYLISGKMRWCKKCKLEYNAKRAKRLRGNRVFNQRKLSPEDIRGIREAVGFAKDYASNYGITARYFNLIRAGLTPKWSRAAANGNNYD